MELSQKVRATNTNTHNTGIFYSACFSLCLEIGHIIFGPCLFYHMDKVYHFSATNFSLKILSHTYMIFTEQPLSFWIHLQSSSLLKSYKNTHVEAMYLFKKCTKTSLNVPFFQPYDSFSKSYFLARPNFFSWSMKRLD